MGVSYQKDHATLRQRLHDERRAHGTARFFDNEDFVGFKVGVGVEGSVEDNVSYRLDPTRLDPVSHDEVRRDGIVFLRSFVELAKEPADHPIRSNSTTPDSAVPQPRYPRQRSPTLARYPMIQPPQTGLLRASRLGERARVSNSLDKSPLASRTSYASLRLRKSVRAVCRDTRCCGGCVLRIHMFEESIA